MSGGANTPAGFPWRKWAFSAVPVAGVLELVAHVVQIHGVVPDADWLAARAYVASQVKGDDLIAFAPRWTDPIGRHMFGSSLATVEREARADESRFPRAFEVSIRGGHVAALTGWRHAAESHFGAVTVTTLENPDLSPVIDDLVARIDPQHLTVTVADGSREDPCPFMHGSVQSGSLGAGTATPADRFMCPNGSLVGVSIVEDTQYYGHKCIYAPPQAGRSVLRLRFADVHFGHRLLGHHSLFVEAELRSLGLQEGITFRSGDAVIGSATHRDGEGWTPFEFDTSALAGSQSDLTVEIGAPAGERRMYCFEATTR